MATQADLDQLETWLSEAKTARHALSIGDKTEVVWRLGGNRMGYSIPTLSEVDDYIKTLEREIDECKNELGQTTTRRRWAIPVRF